MSVVPDSSSGFVESRSSSRGTQAMSSPSMSTSSVSPVQLYFGYETATHDHHAHFSQLVPTAQELSRIAQRWSSAPRSHKSSKRCNLMPHAIHQPATHFLICLCERLPPQRFAQRTNDCRWAMSVRRPPTCRCSSFSSSVAHRLLV